jgi:hypothetical protein
MVRVAPQPENNKKIALQARNWVRKEIGAWNDCAARYLNIYKKLISKGLT